MNFITRIAVLFYVTLTLFFGSFVILYVFHFVEARAVLDLCTAAYSDERLRLIFGGAAGALLLINYIFYQVFTVNIHKDHTIAFDNPAGRVNVSLMAIEDLIRRVISRAAEVKEVKSKISASKKGLRIRIKLILRAEGSIPEVTSRVQDLVKRKVQDAIGLDEPIDIAIYVSKILVDQDKERKRAKEEEPQKEPERQIPFQGYRA